MDSVETAAPVSLSLELRGDRSEKDIAESRRTCEVKKVQTDPNLIKLIVSMPRLVNGEQANLTADLLFEEIDRLPVQTVVEGITLHGLRFTSEGVAGLNVFLTIHAVTVRHVVLSDIFCGIYSADSDPNALPLLTKAFESSKLESLNLSNNVIPSSTWENWTQQTALQQLILDFVEIDDASMEALASNFFFGHALRDLHVVLNRPMGLIALDAANHILKSCTRLGSLRWVNKNFIKNASKLPWLGLKKMINPGKLLHLVMEGGSLPEEEEIGEQGLCGALAHMTGLQTLKLRHTGLQDATVRRIVVALRRSRPPLECLDLSNNAIKDIGAKAIANLALVQRLTASFVSLILEKNQIGNDGVKDIVTSFVAKMGPKLDLRIRGNPADYSKIALELAVSKQSADTEREELQRECERLRAEANDAKQNLRKVMTAQTHMITDMNILQQKTKHLTEEREALARAFTVLGNVQQVEERNQMMNRISQLEDMVLGRSSKQSTVVPQQPKSDGMREKTERPERLMLMRRASMQSIGEGEVMETTNQRAVHIGRSISTNESNDNLDSSEEHITSPPNSGKRMLMDRCASERWGGSPVLKHSSGGGSILKKTSSNKSSVQSPRTFVKSPVTQLGRSSSQRVLTKQPASPSPILRRASSQRILIGSPPPLRRASLSETIEAAVTKAPGAFDMRSLELTSIESSSRGGSHHTRGTFASSGTSHNSPSVSAGSFADSM
jgi:Ran GTPase-activating protein (RanGAP) involved in mRNA processing and transport